MLVYALGLAIPFLVLAIFWDLVVGRLKGLNKHMNKIKVISGILLIIMGLLLMTNNLNLISVLF